MNTLLTGASIYFTFGAVGAFGSTSLWTGFSLTEALLLGAILSATDPVAVIGALHNLQAPPKLTFLISGEALLNDGSGVLLFVVFLDLAKGTFVELAHLIVLKLIRIIPNAALIYISVRTIRQCAVCAAHEFR